MRPPAPRRAAGMRGTGLAELLVGLALGLGVLMAAAVLLGGPLQEQRRLLAALRQHQDLDAAMATAHAELRRAGSTVTGATDPALALDLPAPSPPAASGAAGLPESVVIDAAWSPRPRAAWSAPVPGAPPSPGDQGGWRLDGRTLSWRSAGDGAAWGPGDVWQPQTDPVLAPVAGLWLHQRRAGLGLGGHCPRTACPPPPPASAAAGTAPCGPWWWRRDLHLLLDPAARPEAAGPARLGHHLSLRHDWIQGECP